MSELKKIPVLDMTGLTPFQKLHDNEPELILQGTRVVALFTADDTFYELSERYNRNEPVSVLDFVHCQREIRSRLLSLKGKAS